MLSAGIYRMDSHMTWPWRREDLPGFARILDAEWSWSERRIFAQALSLEKPAQAAAYFRLLRGNLRPG